MFKLDNDGIEKERSGKGTSKSQVLAKKLAAAVRAKKWDRVAISIGKWTSDFSRLLRCDPPDEVAAVLDWYIKNINDTEMPKIVSASGFASFYEDLLKRYNADPSTTEISEKAKFIAEALKCYSWPSGSDQELAATIQRSLDNHKEFRQKLAAYRANVEDIRKAGLIDYICGELGPTSAFVESWLEYVGSKIRNWTDWDGSLIKSYVWHQNHKLFRKQMYTWCTNFGVSSKKWDELLKELK